jgi:hypothetical protein
VNFASLFTGSEVRAHIELSPAEVNRYVSVAALGDKLELSLTFLFGDVPAADERKRMDVDGDGTLSDGETEGAAVRWGAEMLRLFSLNLDGRSPVAEPALQVDLGNDRSVGPVPLVIEARWTETIARQPHDVQVEAVADPPRAGELELGTVLGPDWTLTASRLGEGPAGQQLTFKLPAHARGPRKASFSIAPTTAKNEEGSSGRKPWLLVGLVGAAAAVLATLTLRGRRQPARTRRSR